MSSIWRFPPERNNPHPAPYPLVLPLRIIYSLFDNQKGTVIDPYIGSGTTAVAAKLLGCDYICIDISDEYIKMAEETKIKLEQDKIEVSKVLAELKTYNEFIAVKKMILNQLKINNKKNIYETIKRID